MPRNTKFSTTWLEKKLENGDLISSLCKACENDQYSAYCKLYDKRFSISNMGFSQVISYSKNVKHQSKVRCSANQSTFAIKRKDQTGSQPILQLMHKEKNWIPSTLKEKTLKAEALLLLSAVKCNFSFASIDELRKVMALAFEESDIAKSIKLSDSKARYMVKFGLGPYFRQKIFSDLLQSSSYYTIYFDETSSKQVKKQMDVYIAYWSEKYEKVVAK